MQPSNATETQYLIFMISTHIGCLGLNIAYVDTVMIFEKEYNERNCYV